MPKNPNPPVYQTEFKVPLKGILVSAALGLIVSIFATQAKSQQLTSQSQAQAGSASYSGSQSGVTINNNGAGNSNVDANGVAYTDNRVTTRVTGGTNNRDVVTYQGAYDVNSNIAAAATAPGIITANPCGLGYSGGGSAAGWGVSLGGTTMDQSCVLLQQANALNLVAGEQAATYHLAAGNEKMCETLRAVKKIPANAICSQKEREAIEKQKAATSTKTRQPQKQVALFTKCNRRADGKINIKYTKTGKKNMEIAQSRCLATLK